MSASTPAVGSSVRHKSFAYRARVEWLGKRTGLLTSEGKPDVRVASPPEFKGEAGVWTPEDLLVAAVNACTMTTFAAFAERLGLPIVSYASDAEGVLDFADDAYRITRVTLRPIIEVGEPEALKATERAIEDAHRRCIIANSIRASVALEPIIRLRTPH